MTNDLLALAAAACWAVGSMISVTPARHLGAFAFVRLRMLLVAAMLWLITLASGGLHAVTSADVTVIALSGLVGIIIGDSALFSAMNRLGPRRSGILFSTNALMSAVLGYFLFGERMSPQAMAGAVLTISGVMIAILYGRRKTEDHLWEANEGSPVIGIGLGLLAAFGQSAGTLIAKPVMAAGMDPFLASAIRVTVACCGYFILLWLGIGSMRPKQPLTPRIVAQTALSGLVGMALGMSFLLWALRLGNVGMVAILSSVTPILVLPLLWFFLRRPPARGAWIGAVISVAGTALILTR